ncbi:hypothetical protein LCI18_000666 [Fusarium solani-melongenae]|uniref:Uncharacterized protein n=1 Tax=Fusarium solani subsp. cucurbitae TaxID=2747967 RepID=A0ACD3YLH0_FUSSC|nr:hypothetical protein LCI18_000666 [Fusarium solani-melongenae]
MDGSTSRMPSVYRDSIPAHDPVDDNNAKCVSSWTVCDSQTRTTREMKDDECVFLA